MLILDTDTIRFDSVNKKQTVSITNFFLWDHRKKRQASSMTSLQKTTSSSILVAALAIILALIVTGSVIIWYTSPINDASIIITPTDRVNGYGSTHNSNHHNEKSAVAVRDRIDMTPIESFSVQGQFPETFPQNEANFITKPYQSSVSQCHLTANGVACEPMLRNVRWKEPLEEIYTYDINSPITRRMNLSSGVPSPCMNSLQS